MNDEDDKPITFLGYSQSSSTIRLSGGRTYSYSFADFTRLMLWTKGSEVEIELSDDENYPIHIMRTEYDGDRANPVRARDPSTEDGIPEFLAE
jgi:hypothetical protein